MARRTGHVRGGTLAALCATVVLCRQLNFTAPKAPIPRASQLVRFAEGSPARSRFDPPELQAPVMCERSSTGLAWQVLEKGQGSPPLLSDTVLVRYTGWRAGDGQLIDSSYLRQGDTKVKMTSVIPGWKEGLQMMSPGEKRRFWIPADLGFVTDGMDEEEAPGPPGDLVYDVEFVGVTEPEADPIFVYVGVAAAFLFTLTSIYALVAEEPERFLGSATSLHCSNLCFACLPKTLTSRVEK